MGKFLSAAAIAGFFKFCNATIVACALFKRLSEPSCLAEIFLTPANSKTVRIELPAITPVPWDAGLMKTSHAPKRPVITCGNVFVFVKKTFEIKRFNYKILCLL